VFRLDSSIIYNDSNYLVSSISLFKLTGRDRARRTQGSRRHSKHNVKKCTILNSARWSCHFARNMTVFLHNLQFNAILPSGGVVWRVWTVGKDGRYLVHQKLTHRENFEHFVASSFQVVFTAHFPADYVRCRISNGSLEFVLEGKNYNIQPHEFCFIISIQPLG
jgi:hypothetical protein